MRERPASPHPSSLIPSRSGPAHLPLWTLWQAMQLAAFLRSFTPASLPSATSLAAATRAVVLSFQLLASPLGGLFLPSSVYSSTSSFFSASLALPATTLR